MTRRPSLSSRRSATSRATSSEPRALQPDQVVDFIPDGARDHARVVIGSDEAFGDQLVAEVVNGAPALASERAVPRLKPLEIVGTGIAIQGNATAPAEKLDEGYRGGADAVLSVLADRNQVTGEVGDRSLNLAKTRYGEEGPIAGFSLRFVELGLDEDGDPFGACVIDPALDQPPPSSWKAPAKDPLPIVALKGAFAEIITVGRDVPVMGDGPNVRAVTVEQIRPEFRRRYATAETDGEKAANTIRQAGATISCFC